jgi:hypothetical protein
MIRSLFGEISFAFLFLSSDSIGSFNRRVKNELDANSSLLYISTIDVSARLDAILQLCSYTKCATDVIYAVMQNYANYAMNSDDPGAP